MLRIFVPALQGDRDVQGGRTEGPLLPKVQRIALRTDLLLIEPIFFILGLGSLTGIKIRNFRFEIYLVSSNFLYDFCLTFHKFPILIKETNYRGP